MLKSQMQSELLAARQELAKVRSSQVLVSRAVELAGAARAIISDGLNHRSRDGLVRTLELFERSYGSAAQAG
jgi:hypothetical protein